MSSGAGLHPLTALLGRRLSDLARLVDPVVAGPEAARAFLLAAAAEQAGAPVLLAATPTAAEAEHLAHDLAAFLPAERVLALPAWDTLPFERISPGIDTTGQRLRALWRLGEARAGRSEPVVVVAPVKALLQRLATTSEAAAPVVVRLGQRLDPDELVERLVAAG